MALAGSLTAILGLSLLVGAGLASAQTLTERPDGWVTENGRILHEGEARPANLAVHPATRADWISECNRRLVAANHNVDTSIGFDSSCRAWLDYYEGMGATAQGYDFAYAIPVRVSSETRITTIIAKSCGCAPAPRQPKVREKRVRM